MKQRTLTALCGIPLLIAFVWFDTPWFPLLIFVVAGVVILGIREFYQLASKAGGHPLTVFGTICALAFVVVALFGFSFDWVILLVSMLVPMIWLYFRSNREHAVTNWAWTLIGIVYVGWLMSHYVAIRNLEPVEEGRGWVFIALFSTFACDTSAYLIGRSWGKHLMAPSISPAKTWEGAAAGLIGAIVAVVVINAIMLAVNTDISLSLVHAIILGCLIGVVAQIGDLLESSIKRKAGAKDAGSILPGHGGLLDRIDSIMFTGVVVYYYVMVVIG